MSHQFDYLIILFYRVKESNLPKTSCKGAVPADEPTRYKVSGSDRNRTCDLFRGDCFQDSLMRQPTRFQKIKKLPSQEQDLNPYFQLNIWRATNYTIQLSFLNARCLSGLEPDPGDPQSPVLTTDTIGTLLKAGFGPATSALWGQRSTVWTSST